MTSLKTKEILLWCDAEPHDDKNLIRWERKKSGGTLSMLEEEDVDEYFQTLTEKHKGIRIVYCNIDCGLELSTVVPTRTIVMILHLLFLCLGLHLNTIRRNLLQKRTISVHLVVVNYKMILVL